MRPALDQVHLGACAGGRSCGDTGVRGRKLHWLNLTSLPVPWRGCCYFPGRTAIMGSGVEPGSEHCGESCDCQLESVPGDGQEEPAARVRCGATQQPPSATVQAWLVFARRGGRSEKSLGGGVTVSPRMQKASARPNVVATGAAHLARLAHLGKPPSCCRETGSPEPYRGGRRGLSRASAWAESCPSSWLLHARCWRNERMAVTFPAPVGSHA